MTNDQFKIYTEQLREGNVEKIHETFAPDFLDINERDLHFDKPVKVDGEAYLAEDELVLHLNIATVATLPCLVCNEPVDIELNINEFYHAVPLQEIKTGVYNLRELLRETILVETPLLAECCQGKCPQRKVLKKYFKKDDPLGPKNIDDEGYQPFADLDFDVEDKS